MNAEFTENRLHDRLWDYLTKLHTDDCFARNWKGWSYRVGKKKRKKSFFYREFDIARFHREKNRYTTELLLYGYEIKGYEKVKKTHKGETRTVYKEPAFGLGIDQTLILLYQGADFSYLVIPEPKKDRDKNNIRDFCDKYADYVGLIFINEQVTHWEFRKAKKNPYTTEDRKKKMLTSLISAGQFSDIITPTWCKKHEF